MLVFALITSSNIRALVKELIDFLDAAETEFKTYITTEILMASEKFAPSSRWHVDTVLSLLIKAGAYIREDMIPSITQLFAATTDMHAYAVQCLYKAMLEDISSQPLCQVALWCLGEFGHLLFQPTDANLTGISESDVLDVIQAVLDTSTSTQANQNK